MELQSIFLKALAQQRRMYQLLSEVMDISQQLAQSMDREDSVSVHLFLSMRGEPIRQLTEVKDALDQLLEDSYGGEEGLSLARILKGEEQGSTAEQQALSAQVETNRRLHAQVVELDRRLSQKLAREKSFYAQSP